MFHGVEEVELSRYQRQAPPEHETGKDDGFRKGDELT